LRNLVCIYETVISIDADRQNARALPRAFRVH
jgi:hypothetical protein